MRRVEGYLAAEVLRPFAAGLAVMTVLYLCTEPLTAAVKLVTREHLPAGAVFTLMLCQLPWSLGFSIPMACGLAVALGFGRLCREGEYVALLAGGMGFRSMLRPVLLVAGGIGVLGLLLQEWWGPAGMQAFERGRLALVRQAGSQVPELHLRLNDWRLPERIALTAGMLDARARRLEQVRLESTNGQRPVFEVWATAAQHEPGTGWVLHEGYVDVSADAEAPQRWSFAHATVREVEQLLAGRGLPAELNLDLTPEELATAATSKPEYLTYAQIRRRLRDDTALHKADVGRTRMYILRRSTLAASVLLFALVGAPLAVRPERGAQTGGAFGLGLALVAVYYLSWNATTALAERSAAPALWAWSTMAVGLVAGWILSRRVAN